jgi:actin related protein 2/3 complex subunit 2
MILLERGNRILGETVSAKINFEITEEEKMEPIDVKLSDFDDVSYRVLIEPDARNVLKVAMAMPWYRDIQALGGKEAFEKAYGALVTEPLNGFDVTVKVNLDELKEQKVKDELVEKLACIKANVLCGIFDHFFSALLAGKPIAEPFRFKLHHDTEIFLFPKNDRVTVIFGLDFKEKVDRAIAKIFMMEFVDAKRTQGLGAAPPCQWSVNPPNELAHYKITDPTGNLGFISFAVQKSNVDTNKKDRVISVLQVFRNYLQYHIKCSKSYFHARMRARVITLLSVLNRAKYSEEEKLNKSEKKTAGGRTFNRQESKN